MATITLDVNGKKCACDVDEDKPLLWVLRENLEFTGTKYGCGIAMCGACTVLIEDAADIAARIGDERRATKTVRSCVARAGDAQAWHITTIEGLSTKEEQLVQQAWIDHDVPQCGYCQSGQILTTVALLNTFQDEQHTFQDEQHDLNDEDINAALAGNLCRCGTYVRIREAVKAAAKSIGIRVKDRQ
jgi:isoquinoline 1-oxidoreductase alpha subunit